MPDGFENKTDEKRERERNGEGKQNGATPEDFEKI